ncbi:MAG TPA: VOC family protein [Methylomirabilota bacterium]|jgi:catechol 2,3-dioxygenase-like lactoylglutathione lyase family enzyme|nr:VOC family protein [Methylomirabilota bacterium]
MTLFNDLACVSIAVRSISEALPAYTEGLGLTVGSEIQTSPRGFGLRWIELGDGRKNFLELLEPSGSGSLIEKFLARPGRSSVYQVRLSVKDLDLTLSTLQARGVRVIRGPKVPGHPRLGWIHPASTHGVLFELLEAD